MLRAAVIIVFAVLARAVAQESRPGGEPPKPPRVDYENDVGPLFESKCAACHAGFSTDGGLDLSTYESALKGGSSGPVLKARDVPGSRLFRLVNHDEAPHMPKDSGKLADAEIETLRVWIEDGLAAKGRVAPASQPTKVAAKRGPESQAISGGKGALGPPGTIRCIAVPRGGKRLVVGVHGGVRSATDDGRTLGPVLAVPGPRTVAIAFGNDPNKALVAAGRPGRHGAAFVVDLAAGSTGKEFGESPDEILAAALSPGGSIALVGGCDKLVRAYLVASGEWLYTIDGHRDWVLAIDVSRDGNLVASADRAGNLLVSQADSGRPLHALRGHEGAVTALSFRADAQALASAGEDGTVRVFELEDGRELRRIPTGDADATAVAWSAEKELIVGGTDGIARIFSEGGEKIFESPPLGDWITAVAADPAAKVAYAATYDGRVHVVDLQKKIVVRRLGD